MYKHKLLQDSYEKLGLDFKEDHSEHLYIFGIHIGHFRKIGPDRKTTFNYPGCFIKKIGLKTYYYLNIYEALLWYNYKYSHKHFLSYEIEYKNSGDDETNLRDPKNAVYVGAICTNYFWRVPVHYRNLKSKEGLKLMKNILDRIIIYYNGVPDYYDATLMDDICFIK